LACTLCRARSYCSTWSFGGSRPSWVARSMSCAMRSTSARSCRQVASSFIRSLARTSALYSSLWPSNRPSSPAFWSITASSSRVGQQEPRPPEQVFAHHDLRPAVRPGQRRGRGRALHGDHPVELTLDGEAQRDAPAARSNIRRDTTPPSSLFPLPRAASPIQHSFHEPLCLGPRDERARVDLQLERAKADAPDRVGKWDATRAALDGLPEAPRHLRRGLPVASQPDVAP